MAAGEPGRALAQESTASTDRAALVALYNATDGPNWENCYYYPCKPTANWLSDKPIGEWSGVTTNADGRVTSLSLPGHRMKGQLPAELGNLSELGYLMLSGNQLTGSIPSELGKLTKLWYLNLINAGLSGSIPPELGNLTELWSLKLQTNRLTGSIPSELGNLTSLGYLRLGKNKLTGSIPSELGNIPELYQLELHQNQLTGSIPPELGNLSQLDELDFSRNRLSGSIPSELGNLSMLQKLRLDNNQLSGSIPPELGNLSMLQRLRLNNNQLGGSIPVELSKLLKLIELDLSWNQLSGSVPTEVQNLPTLQTLNLNVNRLNGLLNQAPVVSSEIPDISDLQPEEIRTISLEDVFSDVDGHSFWVSASSSDHGVALSYAAVNNLYSQRLLYVEGVQAGTATITVTAGDYNGYEVSDSFDVTVALPPNNAPTVASAIADIGSLPIGTSQEVTLTGVFSDADNDTLTLSASSSATAVATASIATDGSKLTVTGVAEGTATITVTAQDSDGNSVSDAFDVTVPGANQAPTVASAISDTTIVNTSGTKRVPLSGVFTDADADSLTIKAETSAAGVATVSVAADYSSLTVTAKSRGTATITVTASDGTAEVSDTFTVTVKAAPVIASAVSDIGDLKVGAIYMVSPADIFSDPDGDALRFSVGQNNAVVSIQTWSSLEPRALVRDSATGDLIAFTVIARAEGTSTITVFAQDSDGNQVSDSFSVTVSAPANNAPTVSAAISDATIVNESGTQRVSLAGVFTDADADSLAITAETSAAGVATVSVAADYSSLTVTAKSRGSATITVTASDGTAEVSDTFTVTVKAAPTVASAIADISELAAEASQEISLSGVFSDADGDALTLSAVSSKNAVATVVAQVDPVTASATAITVTGVGSGTATITVTAQDSDGNQVSDAFDVIVPAAESPQEISTVPGPVIDLTLTVNGDKVVVSWTAPELGSAPKGYIVHLKPEGAETGSGKTKRPKAKKTKVTYNKLEAGVTYNVWVRAQNESGKGERVYATITLPPPLEIAGPPGQ